MAFHKVKKGRYVRIGFADRIRATHMWWCCSLASRWLRGKRKADPKGGNSSSQMWSKGLRPSGRKINEGVSWSTWPHSKQDKTNFPSHPGKIWATAAYIIAPLPTRHSSHCLDVSTPSNNYPKTLLSVARDVRGATWVDLPHCMFLTICLAKTVIVHIISQSRNNPYPVVTSCLSERIGQDMQDFVIVGINDVNAIRWYSCPLFIKHCRVDVLI